MDDPVEPGHPADRSRGKLQVDEEVVFQRVRGGEVALDAKRLNAADIAAEGAEDVDAMHATAEHEVLRHRQPPGRELEHRPHVVNVVAFQGDQCPKLARVEHLFGVKELAVEPHGLADQELDVPLAHQPDQRLGVFQPRDHRLGANDVFAVLQRGDAMLGVQSVGREYAHHVHVVARDQLAIIGGPERHVEIAGASPDDLLRQPADRGNRVAQIGFVAQQGQRRGHVRRPHADHAQSDASRCHGNADSILCRQWFTVDDVYCLSS